MKTSIKIAALLVAIMGSTLASKAQTTKTSASNGIIYSLGVESGLAQGRPKICINGAWAVLSARISLSLNNSSQLSTPVTKITSAKKMYLVPG
jgi:hypothetical protein